MFTLSLRRKNITKKSIILCANILKSIKQPFKLLHVNKQDNYSLLIPLLVFVGIIILGILGYSYIEGYTFEEALYMTVITVGTVGFKEVRPLSESGMWFTVVLILLSLGLFAYALSTITKHLSDRLFNKYFTHNKMEKRIAKLHNHVIVVGYGRNGSQAVKELIDNNIPVVVVENRPNVLQYIEDDSKIAYIQGDATDDNVLSKAGIDRAKALITALASDADNLFVVITAREINPSIKIISRASAISNDKKLKLAGANNVIMPDKVGGQKMAKLVIQPDINEFVENIMLRRVGDVALFEVDCSNIPPNNTKSIGDLKIRETCGISILGIKDEIGQYQLNPGPETVIRPHSMLFVLGNQQQIELLKNLLRKLI